MQIIQGIPVWGNPLQNAVDQMAACVRSAEKQGVETRAALMADHHLGYSVPVGGVIAYKDHVSPSAVGFDIACGNMAAMTALSVPPNSAESLRFDAVRIADRIAQEVSFGVGRKNATQVEHKLFDDPLWDSLDVLRSLKDMAREQLGTVGSGNHYVDVFADSRGYVWVGVHFGSRGLGHKIASHFIKAGGGKDGINVAPVLLPVTSDLGEQYLRAMELAGEYAYAGREWVVNYVVEKILGSHTLTTVHNHHNYAWHEIHGGAQRFYVHRKGATPAFPGQFGFVGGSMGENSVILSGRTPNDLGFNEPEAELALYSTVHGAGRVMSRTEAAGKSKWVKGQRVRVSEGKVSQASMNQWLKDAGVVLRGGGTDESPHCYKRLTEVLAAHTSTVSIERTLTPLCVVMAGEGEVDPYKD